MVLPGITQHILQLGNNGLPCFLGVDDSTRLGSRFLAPVFARRLPYYVDQGLTTGTAVVESGAVRFAGGKPKAYISAPMA